MINIEWLVEQGPCKKFSAGDVIPCPVPKEGSEKTMYILLHGTVDVYSSSPAGGMKKTASVIAGDIFGGREYFTGAGDNVYRASSDIMVYLLTEDSFNDLSWSQPGILLEILRCAYLPPRPPVQTAAPVKSISEQAKEAAAAKAKAAAPGTKPSALQPPINAAKAGKDEPVDITQVRKSVIAAAVAKEISKNFYLPGHRIYTEKDFPMNDNLVYPKEYTCPCCKRTFQDFKIFSSKLPDNPSVRYDLRKSYPDFNAEWYDLITCRNCFFSMFNVYFTEPKPMRPAAIEDKLNAARADIPIDFSSKRDINTVFTMHYLALLCCEAYPNLSTQLQAKLWANISWLYEDVEDKDLEKAAADKCAQIYEQLFMEGKLTPVQEQVACISIAAMQYRAGTDRNLRRYIYTAKANTMGDRTYSKIAEEFMAQLNIGDEPIEIMTK